MSEQIVKTCPDCGAEYIGAPDDNCCAKCFDEFEGMTIEQLCSPGPTADPNKP